MAARTINLFKRLLYPLCGGAGREERQRKSQRSSGYSFTFPPKHWGGGARGRGGAGCFPGLSPLLFLRAPPTRVSPRSRQAQRLGESREGGRWRWSLVSPVSSSLWFSEVGGFDGEAAGAPAWTGKSWTLKGIRRQPFRKDEREGDAKQL